jgi:hypothetical protein
MSIVRAYLDEEQQKESIIKAHIEEKKQAIIKAWTEENQRDALKKIEERRQHFEELRQQTIQQMRQQMPGSSRNPLVIETTDEEFPSSFVYRRRTSTVPTYRPTCERCGQLGHEEPTCETPRRMFVKCELCAWEKSPQRLCMHFSMSKKKLRYLHQHMAYQKTQITNRPPQ